MELVHKHLLLLGEVTNRQWKWRKQVHFVISKEYIYQPTGNCKVWETTTNIGYHLLINDGRLDIFVIFTRDSLSYWLEMGFLSLYVFATYEWSIGMYIHTLMPVLLYDEVLMLDNSRVNSVSNSNYLVMHQRSFVEVRLLLTTSF